MNLFWLLRLSRWMRRPPSRRQLLVIVVVLGICAALVAVERTIGLPDWMQLEPQKRGRVLRF